MKIDLPDEHLEIVLSVLDKHVPECEVRAFGSRVDGKAKKFSDLDLVLVTNGKIDESRLFRLKDAFEESDLPFRVDVLDWHGIGEQFREIIEAQYIVLRERKPGQAF